MSGFAAAMTDSGTHAAAVGAAAGASGAGVPLGVVGGVSVGARLSLESTLKTGGRGEGVTGGARAGEGAPLLGTPTVLGLG
jgi:hypothetical protein